MNKFNEALLLLGKLHSCMEYEYYECKEPRDKWQVFRELRKFLIENSEDHSYFKNAHPIMGDTITDKNGDDMIYCGTVNGTIIGLYPKPK